MKVSIKLQYNQEVYNSSIKNINDEEFIQLKKLLEYACEGKVGFFSLVADNCEHYFGKKVLEESIITIINH